MRRFASIIAACAVVVLAQPTRVVADPPFWQVYSTTNSDLPDDRVFEVAVDRLGRAWLGCGGLTMFDGDTWTTFDQIGVIQIGIDNANTAWCASGLFSGALTHCDGTAITYYNSANSDLPSDWVEGVTVDNNNHVWAACAYTAISEFDGTTWTRHLSSGDMTGRLMMAHDQNNTIWMTRYITLQRYSNGEWTEITVPGLSMDNGDDAITDIACADDGSIWIGTTTHGVGHYANSTWTFYSTENGHLPADYVGATTVDSAGVLWVGTRKGLVSFDGSTWKTYTKNNWVLPDDNVRTIAVGPDNSLWIGTDEGGLLHTPQLFTGVSEAADPLGLVLAPNPVQNDVVVIRFSLPVPAQTEVELYSLSGERVAVVAAGNLSAGDHSYTFDNSGLAPGAYSCVVRTAGRIVAHTPFVVYR